MGGVCEDLEVFLVATVPRGNQKDLGVLWERLPAAICRVLRRSRQDTAPTNGPLLRENRKPIRNTQTLVNTDWKSHHAGFLVPTVLRGNQKNFGVLWERLPAAICRVLRRSRQDTAPTNGPLLRENRKPIRNTQTLVNTDWKSHHAGFLVPTVLRGNQKNFGVLWERLPAAIRRVRRRSRQDAAPTSGPLLRENRKLICNTQTLVNNERKPHYAG